MSDTATPSRPVPISPPSKHHQALMRTCTGCGGAC